jgi:hypothetical protein
MYRLVGAYFLTQSDQDIGFPAFQTDRFSNALFTVSLDKDLKIAEFLPVSIDRFYLIRGKNPNVSLYSLGDEFSLLFFRVNSELVTINLRDSSEVELSFGKFAEKPFIVLQLARFFARESRSRAVQAISGVVNLFDVDEESKFSFISSETSLAALVDGVWEAARPEVSPAISLDDIFQEFESIQKVHAIDLLRDAGFKNGPYWAYLFIVYESKFGIDEYTYILGKEFVRKLAIFDRLPSVVSARVVSIVLDAYRKQEEDRELAETLSELMETSVFDVLCTLESTLFMKVFDATHRQSDYLTIARDVVEIIFGREEALVSRFERELFARLRDALGKLEMNDLSDFALGLIDPTDENEIDRFRELKDDRRKLLASVQAKLRHAWRAEAIHLA